MSQLYEMQQLDKIKAICQVAEDDMGKLSEVRQGQGVGLGGNVDGAIRMVLCDPTYIY